MKQRKERDSNWSKAEILDRVEAKHQEHLDKLCTDDARELITLATSKWNKIASKVNANGHTVCKRDATSCRVAIWRACERELMSGKKSNGKICLKDL